MCVKKKKKKKQIDISLIPVKIWFSCEKDIHGDTFLKYAVNEYKHMLATDRI